MYHHFKLSPREKFVYVSTTGELVIIISMKLQSPHHHRRHHDDNPHGHLNNQFFHEFIVNTDFIIVMIFHHLKSGPHGIGGVRMLVVDFRVNFLTNGRAQR